MKTLIIYNSTYKKNTEQIAKVIAKEIKAELVPLKDAVNISIKNYDLIGFGSGVYKESMAPQLFQYVNTLDFKNKNCFVFSTSGMGAKFYNNKLIKLLKKKGANCTGSFACKGSFVSRDFSNNKIFEIMGKLSQGHPNTKDIKKAEKFSNQLKSTSN